MAIKSENQVVGVLQLINKTSGNGVFTTDDEDVMQIFLSIAGPILASSNLYAQIQGKGKGKDSKGDDKEMPRGAANAPKAPQKHMSGFAEGEEEEED